MELGLAGRVAMIAAASQGLGKGIAMALAREGCDVSICSRRADAIQAVAAEISQATGRRAVAAVADVTQPADVTAWVEMTRRELGPVGILVCNGGGPPPGKVEALDEATWQAAVDQGLISSVRLTRAALPDMKAQGWGRILYITSTSAQNPIPGIVLSNSIRAAITALAKTLSFEVGKLGITVNCLVPGRIDTERLRQLDAAKAKHLGKTLQEVREDSVAGIPVKRFGEADEFGQVAAFLCSQQGSYITGSSVRVDGGIAFSLF